MNKKNIIIAIFVVGGLFLLNFLGKNNQTQSQTQIQNQSQQAQSQVKASSATNNISLAPADKIEIVHFHGTQQCVSCITVGKFAKQTIEEKFSDEVKSGKIVFKEINGELPENRDIVTKYQARGSSLFVNAIRGEKDDIQEDVTVWRLVNNEAQFVSYFENKLNKLLGK